MEENKKNTIHQFLNTEMSSDEEEMFKKTSTYKKHKNIIELFDNVSSVSFNDKKVLESINTQKVKTSKKVIPLYKKWLPISIAASILIICSLFYTYAIKPISYQTSVGESVQVSLPDDSSVWLNTQSKIAHSKNWKESRNVELKGEAYFEVAKGKKFTVNTSEGIVTVLGTKFNVKQRNNYFEVHCFEGSVSVTYNNEVTILKPNEFFTSKKQKKQNKDIHKPNWMQKKSVFNNATFDEVITDISLQYGVVFSIDSNIKNAQFKYTGSYNYTDDIKTVLEVLSKSLNLDYNLKNKTIHLSIKE